MAMALTPAQVRKLNVLSDTVLYPDAVGLINKLVLEEEADPLPSTQIVGLLSISWANTYGEFYKFVVHQRDRDWSAAKSDIKKFYTDLERYLTALVRRVRGEFQLIPQGLDVKSTRQMTDDIMALLVQDLVQHLAAENNRLAVEVSRRRKNYARR